MFRFRFFLAAALTTLLLVTGVEAAVASESSSFRLFGEVSNESENGVGWRSNALTSTNFVMNPGTSEDHEEEAESEEESDDDSGEGSEESTPSSSDTGGGSGGGGGGGGRRTLPSQTVSAQEKTSEVSKSTFQELEKRVQKINTETPFVLTLTEPEEISPQKSSSQQIVVSRRVLARRVVEPASLRTIASPPVDLTSLIALTLLDITTRDPSPIRFQDSWHRPQRGLNVLGAEVAEAYSAAPDTPAMRVGRIVDLINQNLLLSALLIFAAVVLSVLGASPNMRQHCTTIVCVLERDVLHIRPRMQHARLLLRAFLLLLSIGTFFFLTTAYAFAATTTPLRSVYNGRLLSSTGAALTSSHTIRFSLWTSTDAVSGESTGTGSLNTGASAHAGWQEVHTVTPDSNGYFSTELG